MVQGINQLKIAISQAPTSDLTTYFKKYLGLLTAFIQKQVPNPTQMWQKQLFFAIIQSTLIPYP